MKYEHLYVHVPFCARRCSYCDFSIAVRSAVPVADYVDAVASELKARHGASDLALSTLYFGGGTPSKLGGDGVARLIDVIRSRATLTNDCEVTLEANPEDVSAATVRAWRGAGVNRLSLGVQTFDDRALRWMHRTHDAATAGQAVQVARDEGIANVSIDLIFALPDAAQRSWVRDLDIAMGLETPHVSVYGLTVEERTPLGRWVARKETTEAPESAYEHQFLAAHDALTSAGLEHYEVSNYGAPGKHSRHNWAYWNRRPYVGLGPSAHEFDGKKRRWNTGAFAAWVEQASRGADTTAGGESLTDEQAAVESDYLGLRTSAGVELTPAIEKGSADWVTAGWARRETGRLHLTPSGWLRIDSLASDLTLARSRY